MRYILLIAVLFFLMISCKTKPFLKHKIEFEKLSDNCDAIDKSFGMNSNINGERYEFQECLDADFSKEKFSSVRQGDTVVLKFERSASPQVLYKIIVDIDSYPRYSFVTIDGETFTIVPAGN
ncbi:MAG TPA: hypothetical protein PKC72_11990 [Chitinophagaceae bacterium]|nr:hypothetical protein [Chitinophagaceae bacterium]